MTATIIESWSDVSALGAFGLIYGIACGCIGFLIGRARKTRIAPTPEQRCFSDSMRTDRMHTQLTAWDFAHRTDSEPLSTK